jgi:hypothetical protein
MYFSVGTTPCINDPFNRDYFEEIELLATPDDIRRQTLSL